MFLSVFNQIDAHFNAHMYTYEKELINVYVLELKAFIKFRQIAGF